MTFRLSPKSQKKKLRAARVAARTLKRLTFFGGPRVSSDTDGPLLARHLTLGTESLARESRVDAAAIAGPVLLSELSCLHYLSPQG